MKFSVLFIDFFRDYSRDFSRDFFRSSSQDIYLDCLQDPIKQMLQRLIQRLLWRLLQKRSGILQKRSGIRPRIFSGEAFLNTSVYLMDLPGNFYLDFFSDASRDTSRSFSHGSFRCSFIYFCNDFIIDSS